MSVHASAQHFETEQFPTGRVESDGKFYEQTQRPGKTQRDRESGAWGNRLGNRADRVKRSGVKAGKSARPKAK